MLGGFKEAAPLPSWESKGQFPAVQKKKTIIKREHKDQNWTDKKTANWQGKWTIKFGTWNVRGIAEKEVELEEVLGKARVAITVLKETKQKGAGSKRMQEGSMLFYSGVPVNIHAKADMAIVVKKDLKKHIKDSLTNLIQGPL